MCTATFHFSPLRFRWRACPSAERSSSPFRVARRSASKEPLHWGARARPLCLIRPRTVPTLVAGDTPLPLCFECSLLLVGVNSLAIYCLIFNYTILFLRYLRQHSLRSSSILPATPPSMSRYINQETSTQASSAETGAGNARPAPAPVGNIWDAFNRLFFDSQYLNIDFA